MAEILSFLIQAIMAVMMLWSSFQILKLLEHRWEYSRFKKWIEGKLS